MTSGKRRAPRSDPFRVNPVQGARVGQSATPIVELLPDFQQLTRLAFAFPEVSVVEDHDHVTVAGELFGVCIERNSAGSAEAMGHNDHRNVAFRTLRPEHGGGAAQPVRLEPFVAAGESVGSSRSHVALREAVHSSCNPMWDCYG